MMVALGVLLLGLAAHAKPPPDLVRYSATNRYTFIVAPSGGSMVPAFGTMHEGNIVTWSKRLPNKVSPRDALVADDGNWVATFDDFGSDGTKTVVVYDNKGMVIANLDLGQVVGAAEARKPQKPGAWRKGARFDLAAGKLILVLASRERQVDLKSGIISDAPKP